MQLSPTRPEFVSTCADEIVMVDFKTGNVAWRVTRPEEKFTQVAWSSTGDKIAVCCLASQSIDIFDRDGHYLSSISHGGHPTDVAFSADGSLLAIIGDAKLQLCDADDGRELFNRPLKTQGQSVEFSHDGALLAYGGKLNGTAVIHLTRNASDQQLICNSSVDCLAFSPDDSIIASAHRDSIIRLWDALTGRLHAELVGHDEGIRSLAFSPDGGTLLSSGSDRNVRAWSVKYGRGFGIVLPRRYESDTPGTCFLGLSSDGRHIAVGHQVPLKDGADVLLWKLETPTSPITDEHP
jgi:WD40 repeat protein